MKLSEFNIKEFIEKNKPAPQFNVDDIVIHYNTPCKVIDLLFRPWVKVLIDSGRMNEREWQFTGTIDQDLDPVIYDVKLYTCGTEYQYLIEYPDGTRKYHYVYDLSKVPPPKEKFKWWRFPKI